MINGTLSGKIVFRETYDKNPHGRQYCGRIDISLQSWVAGERSEVVHAVYFPEFMRKRLEYFMGDKVKYCTVVFDNIVAVPQQGADKPAYVALMANRIEV